MRREKDDRNYSLFTMCGSAMEYCARLSGEVNIDTSIGFVYEVSQRLCHIIRRSLLARRIVVARRRVLRVRRKRPNSCKQLSTCVSRMLRRPSCVLHKGHPRATLILGRVSAPSVTTRVVLELGISDSPRRCGGSVVAV